MALWHVRLGHAYNKAKKIYPEDYKYREDLAINHSIIMIGYNLSVDVRDKIYEDSDVLWQQVADDERKRCPNITDRSITRKTELIESFRDEIKENDWVISPYQNNPNKDKVSMGRFVGEIEILENLLLNHGGLNSFAQKYPNQSADILKFGKMLARRVKWVTEPIDKKETLCTDVLAKIKKTQIRGTTINLDAY